jgi:PAT family beta-lactamase induction signal transducer AmpG
MTSLRGATARRLTMLFLGFSAGIPLLLIFSSLSLWLREAGVERNAVTFFSWAALGYSFKFVWAPLVDRLPLPWLTARYGRRRGWLLLAQIAIITAIVLMASVDPAAGGRPGAHGPGGGDAGLLGGDPGHLYRRLPHRVRAAADAGHAVGGLYRGYRIGMVTSGAGALFLAALLLSSPGATIPTPPGA